jgi:N-acetylglucosaminyldiphosphoundecaprenol N-acetyl-beta-D-mannosaminyltransferase
MATAAHQKVPSTVVLGVPIANLDYRGVIDRVATWVRTGQRRYVGVVPVHSLIDAVRLPAHRRSLNEADLNTADGVPIVWAQMLFGHRHASRVYGPTLTLHLLRHAARYGWRVAFYGGHPDRLETLIERLRREFPQLEIAAAISPPFRQLSEREDEQMVQRLTEARPDIVFVGLGAPKQERWMREHVGRVPGVLLGVGAAFDFHAGAVRQAPPFLQRIGMEWAFRLACEPRRLFVRYARSNPTYVVLLARQWISSVLSGRSYQVQR